MSALKPGAPELPRSEAESVSLPMSNTLGALSLLAPGLRPEILALYPSQVTSRNVLGETEGPLLGLVHRATSLHPVEEPRSIPLSKPDEPSQYLLQDIALAPNPRKFARSCQLPQGAIYSAKLNTRLHATSACHR